MYSHKLTKRIKTFQNCKLLIFILLLNMQEIYMNNLTCKVRVKQNYEAKRKRKVVT